MLVTIAYPYGQIDPAFHHSLLQLVTYEKDSGRLDHPGWLIAVQTTNIAHARNVIVEAFLGTDADWLWFVDTDQVFNPNILERMVESADPVERPILSALVMSQRAGRVVPACGLWDPNLRDFVLPEMIPTVQHWPVGTTGTGCVLIHRSVLEAMRDEYSDDAFVWFKYAQHDRNGQPDMMGEDYVFSLRALRLGFGSTVDTSIEAGHVKQRTLTSADFWAQVPPAQRPRGTFAVVPVKDKFALTSGIVEQLREQAVDQIIVVDNGSGKKTRNWLDSQPDVLVLDAPDAGIHEMWNMGAVKALVSSPAGCDVFFVNNDVELGEGCVGILSEALRDNPDLVVVCPNYDERIGASNHSWFASADFPRPEKIEYRTDICADRYDGTGGIAGFAFMVRGEFLHRYRFPEDCKWWFGDNDLLLTVQASGFKSAIVLDASCVHLDGGGKTGNWEDPAMQAQLTADRDAFMARWSAPVAGGEGVAATPVPAPSGPLSLPVNTKDES